jgi:hypothetical protein
VLEALSEEQREEVDEAVYHSSEGCDWVMMLI